MHIISAMIVRDVFSCSQMKSFFETGGEDDGDSWMRIHGLLDTLPYSHGKFFTANVLIVLFFILGLLSLSFFLCYIQWRAV